MASGRVIIAEGHSFEPSTKPSKSSPNMREVNWSRHAEKFVAVTFSGVCNALKIP